MSLPAEVVEVLPADDARRITDQIKVAVEATWQLVITAYQGRAWVALGYPNWDDYCRREFGAARLRLPREELPEIVTSLREQGLSLRAISAATGRSHVTVRNALAGVQNLTPDAELPVTGIDGKTYKPRHERATEERAAPEVTEDQEGPVSAVAGRTRADYDHRLEQTRAMAAEGMSSRQIASQLGITRGGLMNLCKRHQIEVPADRIVGKVQTIKVERVMDEVIASLEGVALLLNTIEDVSSLDAEKRPVWLDAIAEPLAAITRFKKELSK
jgi:DNA-binding NarL/FixJ family response regulator